MWYKVKCGPGSVLHEDFDATQNSPVVPSQSAVPHAQLAPLAAAPFVVAQVENWLHRSLLDVSQNSPVSDVHTLFPQMQGLALLGADPPVFVHAGAVKVHRHVYEVEQDTVEEVFVLKRRSPPVLLLLLSQHPRG